MRERFRILGRDKIMDIPRRFVAPEKTSGGFERAADFIEAAIMRAREEAGFVGNGAMHGGAAPTLYRAGVDAVVDMHVRELYRAKIGGAEVEFGEERGEFSRSAAGAGVDEKGARLGGSLGGTGFRHEVGKSKRAANGVEVQCHVQSQVTKATTAAVFVSIAQTMMWPRCCGSLVLLGMPSHLQTMIQQSPFA